MEALIVATIVALLWFLEKVGGTPMVIRPIVVSPLVGLALGDLENGLLIGATLELVFMGAIQIGGAVPPDVLFGAGLGTAFAILSGQGADVALALGLPIAIVAQSIKVIVFIVRSWFMDFALKQAEDVNIKGLHFVNMGGLFFQCALYFAATYMAIAVGTSAVEAIIAGIPAPIMNGLKVAGGMLPAVGFALLLQPMLTVKNVVYFIVGFTLLAYLKLPVLAITIIGVGVAFIVCFEKEKEVVTVSEEEVLFDE